MGCNCNKGNQATVYTYTSPEGVVSVFRTEIEARAAQIRNGGGEYVANAG